MCPNQCGNAQAAKKVSEVVQKRENYYVFTRNSEKVTQVIDNDDILLKEFEQLISSCKFLDVLDFYKTHGH